VTGSDISKADGLGRRSMLIAATAVVATAATLSSTETKAQTPTTALASWNDGPAKQAILDFVRATTDQASPKFVPPEDRIATFDQDGTLWVEHPMYSQLMYCLDRLPLLTGDRRVIDYMPRFRSLLAGDLKAMDNLTKLDMEIIAAATLSGMTVVEFTAEVRKWIATAKDPRWKRPYTDLTYQPMQEMMSYFRANGYKTYIVTGGGQDFVRVYAEHVYGVPPEQVVGSPGGTSFEYDKGGEPVLIKDLKLIFNDDNAGKPEGIHLVIGRRPNAAVGNSTGDQQMLEYATAGGGARLGMLVLHDDAQREYAYGPAQGLPDTKVGTFDQALHDAAKQKGWTVISMKNDWKRIFAFEGG